MPAAGLHPCRGLLARLLNGIRAMDESNPAGSPPSPATCTRLAHQTTDPAVMETWASLVRDLGGMYNIRIDGSDAHRGLRYVAIAHRLDIRPCVVISALTDRQ